MAVPGVADRDAAVAVRALAARAAQHAPALGREIWARVVEAIPGASDWDASLVEAGPPAAEAIIRELAGNLVGEEGTPMRSAALGLAHARQFAREEVPLATLLRIYQLGHELWRDFYVETLGADARTPEELVETAGTVSTITFAFLHAATDEVVRAYDEERVRVRESGQRARRRALEAVLAGEAVDVDSAGLRLGVELRRAHTALMAVAAPPAEGEDPAPALERVLREVGAAVGVERPLVVAPGWTTAFAWLTRVPSADGTPLHHLVAEAGLDTGAIAVTCGSELRGVEGFRTSHLEALAARAFAAPGRPVTYEAVELASLLSAEPERAHAFACRELGGLAAPDEATARLRATLAEYLAAGSSATRTAERLGVHKNTVVYRVRQAEVARGARLHQRRLELEAALRLADALPGVLDPPVL